MQKLSKSISDLRLSYNVVVVGSGYGGGVAASRLARCGKSVCVLERGKEFALGEFPNDMMEAQQEFQVSQGSHHIGAPQGLFDLRMGNEINVFVGCGLGGTSLINANVSLTTDPRVWEDTVWPEALVGDQLRQVAEDRAKAMLRPTPYPDRVPLKKLNTLRSAAAKIGATATTPPINVTFDETKNDAGVVQPPCTLCGDCCAGCNVGAKNTTQMNYLPDAVNHGAEIFTGTSVRSVRKERGKWRILFDLQGHQREQFGEMQQSIIADVVILAAGTLGSTEILLRSRENGLRLSERLGENFTGNGDVLAFGYNNDVAINGVGFGHPPRVDIEPVGPCIAGLIDLRDKDRLEDGYVIEEGSIPSGIASILPMVIGASAGIFGTDTDHGFLDALDEKSRDLQSHFLGAYKGAINNTQTYLAMSHDDGNGTMSLDDDRLSISWPGVARQEIFDKVDATIKALTEATGGRHLRNPMSNRWLGENLVTVHPLGGCVIGTNRNTGVVNHKCQVYDGDGTRGADGVHQGLYVCDGAVIPRPLGVNPLLTITTLAERAMIHLARDRGWAFDTEPKPDAPTRIAGITPLKDVLPAGVEFTERMSGFISLTDVEPTNLQPSDYKQAGQAGRAADNQCQFTVTILVNDIDTFIADKNHTGTMIGIAECPMLSNEPLDIVGGVFNLMRPDEDSVETRQFNYHMTLAARNGEEFLFSGYKIVHADAGLDLWHDTTTLFVDIWRVQGEQKRPHARGILTIAVEDFAKQIRTMKAFNGRSADHRLTAIAKFGTLFAGSLYDVYGGILKRSERYSALVPRKKRALRVSPPEVHLFETGDGKQLRLTRYRGGDKGPVILSHGLGVSGTIFSLDTIDTNLVEYLYAGGFDCWVLDYRASVDLKYCAELWTADDVATQDYPAAIDTVRRLTGAGSVQMLVHCFGATTFFMSMLAGLQNVRSAVVSQIATDVIIPWWPQRLLAHLRAPSLLKKLGIDVVDARAETHDKLWEQALDAVLRLVIPFQDEERSRNATSNRITALYGPLYELDQINQATLDFGIPETFGKANIDAFRQLAAIARKTYLLDAKGRNIYLPHLERLSIPICFVHGAENACFRPESTKRTMERLSAANGAELYERNVIANYGHIDCIFGKNAARDVYPIMARHLDKTA